MSENENTNRSGGIGFIGLLTICFIVLKLTNFIAWSWWWVFSPIWIVFSLYVLIVILAIIITIARS